MGKSPKQEMEVTDYKMSMLYGICTTVDELTAIYVGEKEAWKGSAVGETQIPISKPDLFGGPKKEGGVSGIAHFFPGGPSQVMPDGLAAKMGLTSATCPGYRGISSVFFYGSPSYRVEFGLPPKIISTGTGFLWGTNNPYLRSIWMRVKRSPKALDPTLRMVSSTGTKSITTNGENVTVNGVTATVRPGYAQTINGSTVLLNNQILIVDGIQIKVDMAGSPNTLDVGGVQVDFTGSTASVNGVSITVSGTYEGRYGIVIANYTATIAAQEDANPAAIIYECLTDRTWGGGMSPSLIKTSSFIAAAQQLKLENFGLSLQWTRQSDIESFVSEILDHIQATLFINPRDGLLTLKLIRDDYDPATLPVLNPDNCEITKFDRKAWGETVNEIVVTWTNPENEQEETVTAQNLANIVIQGSTISDSRNYYGVRNRELALRLAYRDLALSSSPLAAFEIDVDRSAWNFVPGGCVRLVYPEYGIDNLVLRIASIDYGKPGDPTIKVSATEDLFALPAASYEDPDQSAWLNPKSPPNPLDYVRLITAPGFFTSAALAAADAQALDYPEVFAALLAATDNQDTSSYNLLGQQTMANGEVVSTLVGQKPLLGFASLPDAIGAQATTLVPTFGPITGGVGPVTAGFVFIGNKPEGGQEIALIQSIDETGYTLKRGVLDTTPRDWPAGTPCWFVLVGTNFIDLNNVHSASETVVYKMQPSTSIGTLSIDEAPVVGVVLTARPYLPTRPANVTVAGIAFGSIDLSSSPPSTVHVSWANRNRTMEDSQVLSWTDGTVTPEAGQTTTVSIWDVHGNLVTTHDALTGTSFDVPIASFGDKAVCDVRVTAKRDGLESLQGHTVRVKVRNAGFGDNWGSDWGGSGVGGDPGDPNPGDPGTEPEIPPGYEFPPYVPPNRDRNDYF